ncbi:MAG: hypothetical protein IPH31_02080 [Lewinellaceae bacterium]|nr:hypothetical protein [Lewinellaceae bacterium]
MLSTVYDASQNENPLDAATFTIDIKDTDFKLIKYMSGSLLYSTDGKIPTEKPTIVVGNSIAKVSPSNQKKYSEERLKKLPRGEQSIVKEINEVTIDNLNGYEIVANGKTKDNKDELVYQVMLFTENGDYYLFVGQTKEEFDNYLERFKRLPKHSSVNFSTIKSSQLKPKRPAGARLQPCAHYSVGSADKRQPKPNTFRSS